MQDLQGGMALGLIVGLVIIFLIASFLLPLLLIFPYLFGIDGVMYTAPIADLAAASVSIVMVVLEFKIMAELQKATA